MRKLVVAVTLAAFTLVGCATANLPSLQAVQTAFTFATKTVDNPISKKDLYQAEAAIDLVFVALNGYKDTCAKGLADVNCKSNVAQIQAFTRQMPPLITQLRGFVKLNSQINALVVWNQLSDLYRQAKSAAGAAGITLGSQ